jgi:hypothetical protein
MLQRRLWQTLVYLISVLDTSHRYNIKATWFDFLAICRKIREVTGASTGTSK